MVLLWTICLLFVAKKEEISERRVDQLRALA